MPPAESPPTNFVVFSPPNFINIPILQMKPGEVKRLAHGHTALNVQANDPSLCLQKL